MSTNFSLDLSNPAVTSGPVNVVYTNGSVGNTLDLLLTNRFGFDLTFGGSSTGRYLLISVSANMIDAAGAKSLTAAAPWTIAAVTPPAGSPEPSYYVFSLLPPPAGVPFPNNASLTITLQDLQPSATGTGQILAHYAFDTTAADDLNVSAPLSVLAPYDPNLPSLFGSAGGLMLTPYVNGGDLANPIMVSGTPVTQATAVDNLVRLNLALQQTGNQSGLVNGWNAQKPPTFRIWFPYFNGSSGLPAPLDLTDSLTSKDSNYNPLTSAWNIPLTLDPTNPKITNNGFWQVALDPTSSIPLWRVTPTAANLHLFTKTESLYSEAGPFLDLYLLNIVSGLPIDPANPETALYFQWNDFPGFNDGSLVYPLQKTSLAINCFQADLVRKNNTVTLEIEWDTTGADYCQITGDADQLARSMTKPPYRREVNLDQPLLSAYTLTAVGSGGKTQVTRTLNSRWQLNTHIPPVNIGPDLFLEPSIDGKQIYVANGNAITFYDAATLQLLPQNPLVAPDSMPILGVVESPDGSAVYFVSGHIYGFNPQTLQPTPGSGAGLQNNVPPFSLAVSPDSSVLAILMSQSTWPSVLGVNELMLLSSATLTSIPGSPVPLSETSQALLVGSQTGNYYIARKSCLEALDPTTLKPIPGSPVNIPAIGLLALSPDETALYACSFQLTSLGFVLTKIALPTLEVQTQIPIGLGFNIFTAPFLDCAALAVSADGSVLFFVGVDVAAIIKGQIVTRFAAYNTRTMDELSWSPLRFDKQIPLTLSQAPDGSRLYVLAALAINGGQGTLYAVDPVFA